MRIAEFLARFGGGWCGRAGVAPAGTAMFGDPAASPIDKALLGAHAKNLLNDPVLSLAFAKVEADLVAVWMRSEGFDAEARELAYAMMRGLTSVQIKLRAFMGDLQMIQAEEKRREAAAKREMERRTG